MYIRKYIHSSMYVYNSMYVNDSMYNAMCTHFALKVWSELKRIARA